MKIREKLRARVEPMLAPAERLEHVFPVQTGGPPWLLGIGAGFGVLGVVLISTVFQPRIVAVTNTAIVIFKADKLTGTRPKAVIQRLLRDTPLPPLRGSIWGKTELDGATMYVHRRFFKDYEAAQAR